MSKNDESRRKRLIKLIHVARRELGMQDEDYRAMLAAMPALGGKTSSADLGIKGLEIVMRALKARGFKVRSNALKGPNTSRKLADDDQSRLIRSLWIQLSEAGAVRNSSEAALSAYVRRVTGVDDLAWLNSRQASSIIEQLKSWLDRSITTPVNGGA
jgi:Mu-like prophage protein gp16